MLSKLFLLIDAFCLQNSVHSIYHSINCPFVTNFNRFVTKFGKIVTKFGILGRILPFL